MRVFHFAFYILMMVINIIYLLAESNTSINIQLGHSSSVTSVAFSPDGKYAISGSYDQTIKLWDVASAKEMRAFSGHTGQINSVAFSPNGKYILSGADDHTLKLWDITTGKELITFIGHTDRVQAVSFSPDGNYALSGSQDNTLKLWDVASGNLLRTFSGHTSNVSSVGFSPNGQVIVSASLDKTIKFWLVSSGMEMYTLSDNFDYIDCVTFSPNSKYVAASFVDKTIKLWDMSTVTEIRTFYGHSLGVTSVAFSPDSRFIISCSWDQTLKLWEISSGQELRTFSGHSERINSVVFSPDGKVVLSGSIDATLILWDVNSGQKLRTFSRKADESSFSAFSQDCRFALKSTSENSLRLIDMSSGKEIQTFSGHTNSVVSLAYSPNGKYALSGSYDHIIKVWDISTGREVRTFSGHSAAVRPMAISPDSKYALSGDDNKTLILWEIESGLEIRKFWNSDYIGAVSFSPDNKHIIFSLSTNINYWDITTGTEVYSFSSNHASPLQSLEISADGKYILSGSLDNTIKLWDLHNQSEIQSFSGHSNWIESAVFSHDGKYALSASSDNTIKLWDLASGREIKTFMGHLYKVNSIAFSPDDKYAYSGSWDGTLRVWDIKSGELIYSTLTANKGQDYLVWTPEGYFCGTEWAMKNCINIVQGMNVYGIDNFFDTYFRPDIVQVKMQGKKLTGTNLAKGFKTPPDVYLQILRTNGTYRDVEEGTMADYKIENFSLNVKLIAKDTGGGIKEVRLFNNGKIIGEDLRGFKSITQNNILEKEYMVSLVEGENTLKAIGISNDLIESNPFITTITYSVPQRTKPNMYIFAIGIDEYKNNRYNLNYCVADVKGFLDVIRPKAEKIFNQVEITALYNQEANRENTMQEIEKIKSKIKVEDVFIFFYAGHGIAIETADNKTEFFYILPEITQMTDEQKCRTSGFSGSELKKIVTELAAQKQIIFVDACNSGAFATTFAVRGAAEENALAKLSRATGSVVIASTTNEQFAQEFRELNHGVFTFVLIDGLSGNAAMSNGQITAASVKMFIDDKLPEAATKYKGTQQFPVTFMFGQDFPIGLK